MRIKQYLGLRKKVFCDRCHKDITKDYFVLCNECFYLDPSEIRQHQTNLPYMDKVEGKTCSLCKKEKSVAEVNHVCKSCLSQHNDNTHSGWYINGDYSGGHILYRHCYCGDLLKLTTGEQEKFEYYKVGNRQPTLIPYRCTRNVHRNEAECHHDWIVLGSNAKDLGESQKEYLKMKENPGLQILELNNIGLDNMVYGSTQYWCCKCGCYYDLSPLKSHLLPFRGYIY